MKDFRFFLYPGVVAVLGVVAGSAFGRLLARTIPCRAREFRQISDAILLALCIGLPILYVLVDSAGLERSPAGLAYFEGILVGLLAFVLARWIVARLRRR